MNFPETKNPYTVSEWNNYFLIICPDIDTAQIIFNALIPPKGVPPFFFVIWIADPSGDRPPYAAVGHFKR